MCFKQASDLFGQLLSHRLLTVSQGPVSRAASLGETATRHDNVQRELVENESNAYYSGDEPVEESGKRRHQLYMNRFCAADRTMAYKQDLLPERAEIQGLNWTSHRKMDVATYVL